MDTFPKEFEIPVGKRTIKYRFFEILPGLLSWSMLVLPIALSILDRTSRLAAIFILFFMMGWFYRAVGMAFRTLQGYQKMKQSSKIPWLKWLAHLENPENSINSILQQKKLNKEDKIHLSNLRAYSANPDLHDLKPSEVVQFMIVPMWKESYEVVAPTIQSLIDSNYDAKQVVLVIAYEKRGGEVPKATANRLIKEFGSHFMFAKTIEHPDDLPNEIIGKGGNVTWAARQMVPWFEKLKIDASRVIVTTLDADNRPHPDYFAHLSYSYILTNDRKHHSYQPSALYTNNIWDVPAAMRVLAVGNSFFTITQSVRPHLLRNFSSHAQSLDALIETDFWSVRTVVEDGHQFWRSYFAFGGNHQVVPLYSPIYQDAVLSDTYKATLRDQFTQVQRWAYGASDIPYIANIGFRSKKNRVVPLNNFIPKFFRLLDTHVSWATVSLLLLLSARVPLLIGPGANKSIVAHQLPIIASYAQTLAMVGLFISIFLSMKLLPPRPARYKRHRNVLMVLQWVLLPLISIAYGSMAALNSQTRLMLGKYLDKFALTHKGVRSKPKTPAELTS